MPLHPTIEWKDGAAHIIDQTLLPTEFKILAIRDVNAMDEAIRKLRVRGAPAIGVAGALGVVIGARAVQTEDHELFKAEVNHVIDQLAATRPTAVNLFWALERMRNVLENLENKPIAEIKRRLEETAVAILKDDQERCLRIGRNGAELIKDGEVILTHCNAGALATAGIGTALAVIYTAAEQGKCVKVFADETRPLLQGARLTAWELKESGIDVTLITDNMAAHTMREKKISAVVVGADRIASNGDAANKIGTYGVALAAKAHNIPFYVAAPLSTMDFSIPDGSRIPIEERGSEEVTEGFGKQTAPDGIKVYAPAFDVTPNDLITAIITDKGNAFPPFEESLKKLADEAE